MISRHNGNEGNPFTCDVSIRSEKNSEKDFWMFFFLRKLDGGEDPEDIEGYVSG